MDFRKESSFFLKKYLKNGFTIWAILMWIIYQLRFEPMIAEFRASLWLDQLMWAFFVPLFVQVILDVATRIRVKEKIHWFSKNMLLYVVAGFGFGWVLILDFDCFLEEFY